jgi:hypothetical protein
MWKQAREEFVETFSRYALKSQFQIGHSKQSYGDIHQFVDSYRQGQSGQVLETKTIITRKPRYIAEDKVKTATHEEVKSEAVVTEQTEQAEHVKESGEHSHRGHTHYTR